MEHVSTILGETGSTVAIDTQLETEDTMKA